MPVDPPKGPGTKPPATPGKTGKSERLAAAGFRPAQPGDAATVSNEARDAAEVRSGDVQAAKRKRRARSLDEAFPSSTPESVDELGNLLRDSGVAGSEKVKETTGATDTAKASEAVGNYEADSAILASILLGKQNVHVTPQQIGEALQKAKDNKSADAISDAAKALGINPDMMRSAYQFGSFHAMMAQDETVKKLAASLNQPPMNVVMAMAKTIQEVANSGGNSTAEQFRNILARHLQVAPGELQSKADPAVIKEITDNFMKGQAAQGGGAAPPGGGTTPPGASPGGEPEKEPSIGKFGPGASPGDSNPWNIISPDYMQNLQKLMQGFGLNIPPQVMNAQQQQMNMLYAFTTMQLAVQTQRQGLQTYMQILNTILDMNLSTMQNANMQLNMIIDARQKMYALNEQTYQNMFKTTMDVGMGWIKAFGGGGGG